MNMQQSFADMEYGNRKRRTKREEFLDMLEAVTPWGEWVALIEPYYPKGKRGRPTRGIETMLRMYLLQNCFNLSDEGVEDAIYDSYAFRKFMKVDFLSEKQAPDATTLCKFRKILDDNGLAKVYFDALTTFLDRNGKIMHGGTIVDATIVEAPTSTKNADHARDPEMHQVKKGNQWYFGERMHIGADAGTGMIHSVHVTAANGAEREAVPKLVRKDDDVVYGDGGYSSMEKREEIKNDPHLSQIQWRINNRKPYTKNNIPQPYPGIDWHKQINHDLSRVRSKVEYCFLIIKRIFHYDKVRYRGIQKNRTQAYTLCALANLYMLGQHDRLSTQRRICAT